MTLSTRTEATTSNGRQLLQFKADIFRAGVPIRPRGDVLVN